MPFVEQPGYRIHYKSYGNPEAPPLLLIMGLGMASNAWDTLPTRLADRFHVIVFDNRGMGSSSASPAGSASATWPTTPSGCSMRRESSRPPSSGSRWAG